ncbi:MAG: lactonase family protein [Planctomycetes bacterium]|nr:lactonase family protein [Planctomycetota bacterium]
MAKRTRPLCSLALAAAAGTALAGQATAPNGTTLVKHLMGKDLSGAQPGQSVWEPANGDKWAYDVALLGKWVYAASAPARQLLRFECDPATGNLALKEAIPIEAKDRESGGVTLHIRQFPDNSAMLYVFFSTHQESSLLCYAVDAKTGALALRGKGDLKVFPNNDAGGGYGYPAFVWSPCQSRLYYVGVKKIFCYTFQDDGLPVMEGKGIACTNPGKSGRGRGHAVFSPDGLQLYILTEKMEPAGTTFWQADTYDCDPKTGGLTCNSAFDLPNLPQECCEFMGFTPDGKLLYILDERAACYYALRRDPEKGALSILATGKPDQSLNGAGGPPWARGGKMAFSADGKTGYYLGRTSFGTFTLDPATGALSDFSSIGGRWAKLALDPASGNIFLVGGERISIFKSLPAGQQKQAAQAGPIVDLDADKDVELEADRVVSWKNQVAWKARDFLGKRVNGRPALRKAVAELRGHNSLVFKKEELVNYDEDAFDHLVTGSGYTWVAVLAAAKQRPSHDLNCFFGNLKNGGVFEGFWGGLNDDNTLWCGSRNGRTFDRGNKDNPKVVGPKLEEGRFYVLAGRMGAGTGDVTLELFVNDPKPVASKPFPVNPKANSSKMAIGQERDATNHPGLESFIGEIARIIFWERPLADAELAEKLAALKTEYGIK